MRAWLYSGNLKIGSPLSSLMLRGVILLIGLVMSPLSACSPAHEMPVNVTSPGVVLWQGRKSDLLVYWASPKDEVGAYNALRVWICSADSVSYRHHYNVGRYRLYVTIACGMREDMTIDQAYRILAGYVLGDSGHLLVVSLAHGCQHPRTGSASCVLTSIE